MEVKQEVSEEKAAKEALAATLVKNATLQQQRADEADKQRLLSLDSLHAAPPSQGLLPRPSKIEKSSLNSRAATQQGHAAAREVTPADGALRSPRRVRAL